MDFAKYEATGNDFIMIDGLSEERQLSADLTRKLCDRRRGIGADGIIVMSPSSISDLRMRIFNADGSEAEMCGNGIRALFLFAMDRGVLSDRAIKVESGAGKRSIEFSGVCGDETVFTVDMGRPAYRNADIPMEGPPEAEAIGVEIPLDGQTLEATCVSMGNPHCAVFVDSVAAYPVDDIGPQVENHALFPNRTNVDFVEVRDRERLVVRVWERGVGETLACGTGACASLVASKLNQKCGDRATVIVPGGPLEVRWEEGSVFLTGPARHVYDGMIEVDGVKMRLSRRLERIPPYLFVEVDRKIAEKEAAGVDVISFGVGDPDIPTPESIIETLAAQSRNPEHHRYPSYFGLVEFRKAVSDWFKSRFGVTIDPDNEVLPLIGSKEGIAHLALALLDPGDLALVPDPAYPVYEMGTILAGAEPHFMPLRQDNAFLPDLGAVPKEVVRRSKILWINYPNNPTGAVAEAPVFSEAIEFAQKHDIVLAHDNAYSEITYDGFVAPSLLQFQGAREIGVEFHSLSKSFSMTGWRIGFVCGNARVIEALGTVKTNIDSGIFNAIQLAGVTALEKEEETPRRMRDIYQSRRDYLVRELSGSRLGGNPTRRQHLRLDACASGVRFRRFFNIRARQSRHFLHAGQRVRPLGGGVRQNFSFCGG